MPGQMRYELYMSHALAEAAEAVARGERADGAVAVLDDAMVAGGSDLVRATGDPTAHAVMVTVREAAKRLGRTSLTGITVFSVLEPCAMCVGALLAADADGLVFALPDARDGACGSAFQLAGSGPDGSASRRLRVVSGILRAEAEDLAAVRPRR
jgi:tRNA(adenine34) deaminase